MKTTAFLRQPVVWRMLLCAFAYFYVFPYQPKLNNPNENVRLYMTASLVEFGRYDIGALRDRWGWVNDSAVYARRIYSVKAPGTSLLGVPGYFLYFQTSRIIRHPFRRMEALWVCRTTASILPVLLFGAVFFCWLDRQARHAFTRDTVFFSVMLGSLLYGYGMLFVSHAVSAAVSFGAFMWLYDIRHGTRRAAPVSAFIGGVLAGGAALFEYPGFVCSLVLALYGACSLRKPALIGLLLLGCVIPALPVLHFQWQAFGNPFSPGHAYLETPEFRAAFVHTAFGMALPSKRALFGLLLDPGAGLLPLTPILFAGPAGLWLLLRDPDRRLDGLAALAVVAFTALAIASNVNWRGGWTIGPRYLALCVPFLAWPALAALEAAARGRPGVTHAFALGATGTGLLASGLPSAYYPHIPPDITRPLPQLFRVLIAHNYAPFNTGGLLGLFGSLSMIPLLLVAICSLAACALTKCSSDKSAVNWRVLAGAMPIGAAFLLPLWLSAAPDAACARAAATVTRRFSPVGHDCAAVLGRVLQRQSHPPPGSLARLARILREEGREAEAAEVEQGSVAVVKE